MRFINYASCTLDSNMPSPSYSTPSVLSVGFASLRLYFIHFFPRPLHIIFISGILFLFIFPFNPWSFSSHSYFYSHFHDSFKLFLLSHTKCKPFPQSLLVKLFQFYLYLILSFNILSVIVFFITSEVLNFSAVNLFDVYLKVVGYQPILYNRFNWSCVCILVW